MTFDIKNKDGSIGFGKGSTIKLNEEILIERRFSFVSEISALTSLFENNKNMVNSISKFALLIQQTPETVFLDKIFSNAQISCKNEIRFQSIPTIVKKVHTILNYASIPEKIKINHLEFVRNLIKFYAKKTINNR